MAMPDSGRQDDINFILRILEDAANAGTIDNVVGKINDAKKQTAGAQGEGAANAEREAAATNDAAAGQGNLLEKAKGTNRETKETAENVRQTGVAVTGIMGYTLVRVGHQLATFAKAIVSPFTDFIKESGMYDSMSIRFNASTRDLSSSWERIGRVMADTIVPAEEKLASFVKQVADFVEKYPDVAAGAVTIAGVLSALGGIAVFVGTLLNVMAAWRIVGKVFFAGIGAGAGAGAAVGEVGLGVGGTIVAALTGLIGPIVLLSGALIAANAITTATGRPSVGSSAGRLATWGGATAYGAASELIHPGTAATAFKDAWEWLGKLFGVLPKVAAGAGAATLALGDLATNLMNSPAKVQILDLFKQYEKDVASAGDTYATSLSDAQKTADNKILDEEASYNAKRLDIETQFAADAISAYEAYALELQRSTRDFSISMADAEADYYDQRTKAAKSAGEQALKDEIAFQLKMKRMAEDHNDTMWDLAGKRDAGAMIQEIRRYEKERTRAEEDHNLIVAQQHRDLAIQLADMADNYKKMRDRRIRDFVQQMEDNQQNYIIQKQKAAEEEAQKLADLDAAHAASLQKIKDDLADQNAAIKAAYKKQLDDLQQAVIDRINILDPYLLKTQAELDAAAAKEFAYFVAWMNNIMAGGGSGRTNLNYGPAGPQALGGDWFITKPTWFLAGEAGPERATFTPMPHGMTDIASMMAGAHGGGSSTQSKILTLNDQRRFYGGVTNEERRAIKQDTLKILQEVLG